MPWKYLASKRFLTKGDSTNGSYSRFFRISLSFVYLENELKIAFYNSIIKKLCSKFNSLGSSR